MAKYYEESVRQDNPRLYRYLVLAAFAALVGLAVIACWCSVVRRLARPTPTPRNSAAAVTMPPSTPSAAPVRQPTATPKPGSVATPTIAAGVLRLVDPPLDGLPSTLSGMPSGRRFQILLHEKYLTEQASAYIESASELPIEIRDIMVSFSPGQVNVSGRVPLGFLRVELWVRGVWRAVSCRFEAEIVEAHVGGQPAPAALRQQAAKSLEDALKSIADAPVCFTSVEIRQGEVEISGYKK